MWARLPAQNNNAALCLAGRENRQVGARGSRDGRFTLPWSSEVLRYGEMGQGGQECARTSHS